jgi:hypothetical protein
MEQWLEPLVVGGTREQNLYQESWWGRPAGEVLDYAWVGRIGTAIAVNYIQVIVLAIFALFAISLVRRRWVDVEKLPFPNTILATRLIDISTENEGGMLDRIRSNKWLWIGFLFGNLMLIGAWLQMINKVAAGGAWDLTALRKNSYSTASLGDMILPGFALSLNFAVPTAFGLSLMLPIDLLVSFFIVWIIAIVLWPSIGGAIGLPVADRLGEGAKAWQYWRFAADNFIPLDPEGAGWGSIAWGILFAAAIYPMWTGRKELIASIKGIMDPSPEIDKGEALPYRWLWIGTIITGLLFIGLASFAAPSGGVIAIITVFLILNTLIWVGSARFVAEAGGWGGLMRGQLLHKFHGGHGQWANRAMVLSVIGAPSADDPSSFLNTQAYWAIRESQIFVNGATSLPQTGLMLEGFNIAAYTKAQPKHIFIGALVSLIAVTAISVPFWIVVNNGDFGFRPATFGQSNDLGFDALINSRGTPYGWRGYWYYGYGHPSGPDIGGTLAVYAVGFIIAIASYMLRARFTWFIFHPMAIVMHFACSHPQGPPSAWFTAVLLALAVKFIVVRFYGAKAFDQKIVPFALGAAVVQGMFYALQVVISLPLGPYKI